MFRFKDAVIHCSVVHVSLRGDSVVPFKRVHVFISLVPRPELLTMDSQETPTNICQAVVKMGSLELLMHLPIEMRANEVLACPIHLRYTGELRYDSKYVLLLHVSAINGVPFIGFSSEILAGPLFAQADSRTETSLHFTFSALPGYGVRFLPSSAGAWYSLSFTLLRWEESGEAGGRQIAVAEITTPPISCLHETAAYGTSAMPPLCWEN